MHVGIFSSDFFSASRTGAKLLANLFAFSIVNLSISNFCFSPIFDLSKNTFSSDVVSIIRLQLLGNSSNLL